ncbi:Sporulation domain-containing protein [Solidesulfovibrio carbinoliphilus subsp. oakridgensis]|uniref:Sporulation domain-containing protein n=1 Tax=Solidesulfovibrio carbinoliphilus subsp. oakridgensis TaxID=694327 RepID=G7Q5V9_9BACT|nr:SPOR domain-containing protein [Solidesulfovibrio carbinoliphilus]EHJ46896.1 Sporulation domain-containing protein [Solidesulfovibrio carbinoliphilus subsp. oakridgensis]
MKLLSRFNVSQDKGGPRKFSFEISMSGVISVGIVVVLGMCWVFILGILVGRGYRPEAAVPQIAQMMPTTEPKADGAPAAAPAVLKPEELQFMEGLQDKDGEVVADSTQKAPADGKKGPGLKSRDLPDAKSVPMGQAAVATAIPAQAAVAAPKATPPAKPAAGEARAPARVEPKAPFEKKAGPKFVATYQVASFPAREQAQTLAQKLAQKGVSATIQEAKSGNNSVFRVKIQIKGTEAEIADGLKRTGEKGPILLGKKPL